MGDLIKNNKLLRIQQAKVSNTRERNIAKQYFNSGPSIGNLARAAYHWWNSVPELGGEDESGNIIIGGEAPTPGMRNPKSIVKGVKPVVKIVKKNAAKITPAQWTAAQDAAIARGDIAEAQRLRDLHFKVNAPNTTTINKLGDPVHNYHGTTNTFISFDPQKIGLTTGDKSGFFFTDNKVAANFYSHETGSAWNNLKLMLGLYKGHKPQVYDVYLNTTKPMITDFHGGVDKIGREILAKEAIKNGNDANILQNIIDGPPALPHNVTIMRNPKHIKSADAVTYDNKGVRIPLGERDNFNINDIRYGLLPIIGGLGVYSIDKKKQGGQIVKNFKRKFLFGGKYIYDWKNSSIKTSYGYPVYWSNNVPEEFKWVTDFLKNNPNVTGMAVGGGAQGDWDTGPRVIIRNLNSNMITDPNDSRWNYLDKIEAVRHYMVETNFNPYFKISPELEYYRKTKFPKTDPYNTNNDAWRESIISRIIAGDMDGTPEQMKIVDKFEKDFYKLKGNGKYW